MSSKIIMKSVEEIIPYKNNPRINDGAVEHVANSIREFGFKSPIIVDGRGVIIAGHTRLKAAKQLGLDEVPVIVADDLSEEQVKAYRLADNKTGEIATWNDDLLQLEMSELIGDFDMSEFGFDMDDFDLFDTPEEDDFVVEVPEVPKAKSGDVYQLGRHRLMCGDSTKKQDVQKLMKGVRVDLLLTDPPYNVDYTGKTKDALKIENDKKNDSDFRQFLVDAFKAADSVMKPGAVFYIWHADSEGYNFRGACLDVDWEVRQCLIWNKNALVLGRQDYHWKHEPCLYGWKSGGSHLWASDRKQTTVLEFDRPTVNKEHPTMKPVKLFNYQMQNNTKKEDVVLDLFGGSGTTLIASEQNGRISYTMEYDPRYVDVIINRWEQLTSQKAELIEEETKSCSKK